MKESSFFPKYMKIITLGLYFLTVFLATENLPQEIILDITLTLNIKSVNPSFLQYLMPNFYKDKMNIRLFLTKNKNI